MRGRPKTEYGFTTKEAFQKAVRVEVLKILAELEANKPCSMCDGTGWYYPGMDLDNIKCPRCKGTGKAVSDE